MILRRITAAYLSRSAKRRWVVAPLGSRGSTRVPYLFYTEYNIPSRDVPFKCPFSFPFLHSLCVYFTFSRVPNITLINEPPIASLNVINRIVSFPKQFAIKKFRYYIEIHRWFPKDNKREELIILTAANILLTLIELMQARIIYEYDSPLIAWIRQGSVHGD